MQRLFLCLPLWFQQLLQLDPIRLLRRLTDRFIAFFFLGWRFFVLQVFEHELNAVVVKTRRELLERLVDFLQFLWRQLLLLACICVSFFRLCDWREDVVALRVEVTEARRVAFDFRDVFGISGLFEGGGKPRQFLCSDDACRALERVDADRIVLPVLRVKELLDSRDVFIVGVRRQRDDRDVIAEVLRLLHKTYSNVYILDVLEELRSFFLLFLRVRSHRDCSQATSGCCHTP